MKGFGIDASDNVWVHNAVNHKLCKFDSFLNLLQTWDGHDTGFTQEGNTIGFNFEKSMVFWYKGNNECLAIDSDSNKTIENVDYFIEDVPVLKGMFGIKDTNLIVIVTSNHSGEDAKIQIFDIKKHKIVQKISYTKITENVAFRIQNVSMMLNQVRLMLVGLSTGDAPKSIITIISLPDLKLIDQLVTESSLPLFSAVAFSTDLLAFAGPSSIHLGEFDPKIQQLKLVCRDMCTIAGNLHTLVVSRDQNKIISTSNRGRLVCVSVKPT